MRAIETMRELRRAFTDEQAEAIAAAIDNNYSALATKDDLADVKDALSREIGGLKWTIALIAPVYAIVLAVLTALINSRLTPPTP